MLDEFLKKLAQVTGVTYSAQAFGQIVCEAAEAYQTVLGDVAPKESVRDSLEQEESSLQSAADNTLGFDTSEPQAEAQKPETKENEVPLRAAAEAEKKSL